MAFISCRIKLWVKLAGATKWGSGGKKGKVWWDLVVVVYWKFFELENKLICCFKLTADMVGGDIWKLVDYMDRPAS